MIFVGSQKMRNISWILLMVKNTTSIMHHRRLITKPCHTYAQIHIILTSTYYHNIVGLSKS